MYIQLLKSKWMVFFGMASSVFALTYSALLFFIGTRASFVPLIFFESSDFRNLFIAITHTISVVFAVTYFLSFFNRRYNSKVVSMATYNIILFLLGIVLVFRCYYINDVEALIFIMTINGILMTIFLWLLSVLKYDIHDPVTSKASLLALWMRIFSVSGLLAFIFAVLTYYRYTTMFLGYIFNMRFAPVMIDAISVFLFVIGDVLLLIAFLLTFFCEIRLKRLLKKYKDLEKLY